MNLNIKVSPVFVANYKAFCKSGVKTIINQGGSRSGKTYSIVQLLSCLIAPSEPKTEISIVSKTLPHLKRGAIRDFKNIMKDSGQWDAKRWHGTDLVYSYPNGSFIEFFSAENSEKLRGPGRDILFVNEGNLLTFDEWNQLSIRTRKMEFIDYNPVDEFCWIYDILIPQKTAAFIKSTFRENWDFLPKSQIEKIQALKELDPNLWRIFGEGEIAQATNVIYTNYEIDNFSNISGDVVYGLDYGFNHPSALIKVTNSDNVLYVEELLYASKLTVSDLVSEISHLLTGSLDYLYVDNARPDLIEECARAGLNAYPANKNVKAGIDFVKSFKLKISSSSINLIKEIKTYKYKTDRMERVLDEPIKFNDDAMDAMRYAAYSYGMEYWIGTNELVMPSLSHKSASSKRENKYATY